MTDHEEASYGGSTDTAARRDKGRLATLGSIVGLGGTLVCSLSMIAAAVGLFAAGGTAAAQGGMAGMRSNHQGRAEAVTAHAAGAAQIPRWLDVLLRWGPEILVISVLLMVASVVLRRRWAALPAIGGGIILYVGMYVQPNLAVMYATIAVGTLLLILAYVASLRPARRDAGRA